MKRIVTAALTTAAICVAGPALAQEGEQELSDDYQMAVVYGDDAAPDCPEGDICVVARLPENERFRIPPNLRFSDSTANTAWTQRVESLEMIGDFGTLSCSPAGAGGVLGCTQQMIDAAYKDRAEGSNVRFSQLIEAARAERLSTIDVDAAAEQERVEQIEREYLERLERERQGPLPGAVVDDSPPPLIDAEERQIPVEPSKPGPFDDGDEEPVPLDAAPPAVEPG